MAKTHTPSTENSFYAESRQAWRDWLQVNHATEKAIWLIIYKKESKIPTVYYPEAVDEALCFGWIDSSIKKRDDESYYQYFAQRKPKSNWSRVNKEKVEKLIAAGLMAEAGLKMVVLAQQSGTWTALDEVEELVLPPALAALFAENPTALTNWEGFSRSTKRGILEWILNAKRPETREKRMRETVEKATEGIKVNQYEPKS